MEKLTEKRQTLDRRETDRRRQARRAAERKQIRRDYKLSYRRHQFVLDTIKRYGPIPIGQICKRWNEANGENVSYKTIARDIQDLICYDFVLLKYQSSKRGWVHKAD